MKIEEALEATGKASDHRDKVMYAELDEKGVLCWYDIETHELINPVGLDSINGSGWQLYHEVKEIRPEEVGELWKKSSDRFVYLVGKEEGRLVGIPSETILFTFDIERHGKSMIHEKNGWQRLFPPVEDDSIERIEIERMTFGRIEGANGAKYMSIISTSCDVPSLNIFNGKSMKAIFEIAKI